MISEKHFKLLFNEHTASGPPERQYIWLSSKIAQFFLSNLVTWPDPLNYMNFVTRPNPWAATISVPPILSTLAPLLAYSVLVFACLTKFLYNILHHCHQLTFMPSVSSQASYECAGRKCDSVTSAATPMLFTTSFILPHLGPACRHFHHLCL